MTWKILRCTKSGEYNRKDSDQRKRPACVVRKGSCFVKGCDLGNMVGVRNQCTGTGEVNGLLDIPLPSKAPMTGAQK